jgi:hypothetical protein
LRESYENFASGWFIICRSFPPAHKHFEAVIPVPSAALQPLDRSLVGTYYRPGPFGPKRQDVDRLELNDFYGLCLPAAYHREIKMHLHDLISLEHKLFKKPVRGWFEPAPRKPAGIEPVPVLDNLLSRQSTGSAAGIHPTLKINGL